MPKFEVCGLELQEFCWATSTKKQDFLVIVNILLSCYHYVIVHQLAIKNCLPSYSSNVIQVTNSTCRITLLNSKWSFWWKNWLCLFKHLSRITNDNRKLLLNISKRLKKVGPKDKYQEAGLHLLSKMISTLQKTVPLYHWPFIRHEFSISFSIFDLLYLFN